MSIAEQDTWDRLEKVGSTSVGMTLPFTQLMGTGTGLSEKLAIRIGVCPAFGTTRERELLQNSRAAKILLISFLQSSSNQLFSSGFDLYISTQKNPTNTGCYFAVSDWNLKIPNHKSPSVIMNLTATVLKKSDPSIQSWFRHRIIMTGQEHSIFPIRNLASASPRTGSSLLFVVVSLPVTGLIPETFPLFSHALSLNTLTVAPVSNNTLIKR